MRILVEDKKDVRITVRGYEDDGMLQMKMYTEDLGCQWKIRKM